MAKAQHIVTNYTWNKSHKLSSFCQFKMAALNIKLSQKLAFYEQRFSLHKFFHPLVLVKRNKHIMNTFTEVVSFINNFYTIECNQNILNHIEYNHMIFQTILSQNQHACLLERVYHNSKFKVFALTTKLITFHINI